MEIMGKNGGKINNQLKQKNERKKLHKNNRMDSDDTNLRHADSGGQ